MERVALLICSILSTSARVFSASLTGSVFFFFGICPVYAGRGRTPTAVERNRAPCKAGNGRNLRGQKQLFSWERVVFEFFQVRGLKLVRTTLLLLKCHL